MNRQGSFFGRSQEHQNYYDVLNVKKDCNEEELKKAYRKMALKHHPDRNRDDPDGATRRMQLVTEAHDVLSNPNRRKAYDKGGPEGLKVYDQYGDRLGVNIEVMILFVSCGTCMVFVMTMLFLTLLILQMDGVMQASWFVVFIPVWVFDCCICCCCCGIAAQLRQRYTTLKSLFNYREDPLPLVLMCFPIWLLQHVLLCLQLDNPGTLPLGWIVALAPWLLFELLLLLAGLAYINTPSAYELRREQTRAMSYEQAAQNLKGGPAIDSYPLYLFHELVNKLTRAASVVLLLCNINGYLELSWWLVFLPVILKQLLLLFNCISFSSILHTLANDEHVDQDNLRKYQHSIATVAGIFSICTGLTYILLCVRLDNPDVTTLIVFIPFLIYFLAGCYCGSCMFLCLMGGMLAEQQQEGTWEEQQYAQQQQGGTSSSNGQYADSVPLYGDGQRSDVP